MKHFSDKYRENWLRVFSPIAEKEQNEPRQPIKEKHNFGRKPVTIFPSKVFASYKMRPEAREAILKAIDDDETVMELQPLIWGRLTFECTKTNNTVSVGVSEKVANILSEAGIMTMLDLFEQSPDSLKERCRNLGDIGIDDIAWSILNFDRYEEYLPAFKEAIMPGIDPQEFVQVVRRLRPTSDDIPSELLRNP
tara:strand:+ start:9802 stop:10383 length:582 start_codon:yes stop_codon:yes gene_type:complete